ncbi:MAG: DUF1566 domain-containing protein [Rhodanobacteraceae bacterium]
MKACFLPFALGCCARCALAGTPTLPLNDTGIVTCFDASAPIDCDRATAFPQDARFGRDAAFADGRFAKLGAGDASLDYTKIANDGSELAPDAALGDGASDWACTRDNFTGLVWEVKTDDGGLRDKDWLYTWYYADATDNGGDPGSAGSDTCGGTLGSECNSDAFEAAVNATTLCGFDDWRLPVGDELVGLVDFRIVALAGEGTPATIDPDYFPNTITDAAWYWTRDALAQKLFPIFAWFVAFNDGVANFAGKDTPSAVRLVHSARSTRAVAHVEGTLGCQEEGNDLIHPSTLGAFTVHSDGTVSDSRTGLMWDQCLLGQDHANACAGPGDPYTWQQGLAAAESLDAQRWLGHDDWRLPNVRELRSLVERACVQPGIDTNVFLNAPTAPAVLTSSTYPGLPSAVWVVGFDSGGYVATFGKGLDHRVRLVRAGDGFAPYDAVEAHALIFADGFDGAPDAIEEAG